jgi:hypothetical protein
MSGISTIGISSILLLAHVPTNVVEGAYNRAEHIERRTELSTDLGGFGHDRPDAKRRKFEALAGSPDREDGKDLIQASTSDCSQRTVFGPKLRGAGKVPTAIRR